MSLPFPEPTAPAQSRKDVLRGYIDYFRSVVIAKVDGMPADDLVSSRLPSGWTPLELVKHLAYVERRWLQWGFEGVDVPDPWGDRRDDRWHVDADETVDILVARLTERGGYTNEVIERHELGDIGRPGPRWDGAGPPSLERVLLHLMQEYARHAGHLDIVRELADGTTGE